jgi:hypothetical protein
VAEVFRMSQGHLVPYNSKKQNVVWPHSEEEHHQRYWPREEQLGIKRMTVLDGKTLCI